MKLLNFFKKEWRILNQNIYEGARLESNLRAISLVGGIIMVFAAIMAGLHFFQGYVLQGLIASSVIIFGAVIFISAQFFKSRKVALIAALIMCMTVFSYATITGFLPSYTITWIIIIPFAFSYFLSVKYGIMLSIYYWLLYIVLFYTPLREIMAARYEVYIMNRLPLQYTCITMLTSASMMQYHEGVLLRIKYEHDLEDELKRQSAVAVARLAELGELTEQVIYTLAGTIDAKDKYTTGHSFRVAEYAVRLARAVGLPDDEAAKIRQEALLHDVGKIGVPDVVLNKSMSLHATERLVLNAHTTIGADILRQLTKLPGAEEVARCHHERYDGKGYPSGLKGEEIPLHSRIVSIADAYDAMHSDRIYRHSLSAEKIRKELEDGRGTQFDPQFLDIFLTLLDSGELYDIAHSADTDSRLQNDSDAMEFCKRCAEAVRMGETKKSIPKFISNNKAFCVFLLKATHAYNKSTLTDDECELSAALLFAINKVLEDNAVCEVVDIGRFVIIMRNTSDEEKQLMRRKVYAEFFRLTNSELYELECEEI